MMSEEKVLKELKIDNFRHITKDQVIKIASMLDKMDPEVAKKALEQFPDFAKTAKEMVCNYKKIIIKAAESNNESSKAVYDSYNLTLVSLQKILEQETLSFDQKKFIIEKMKEVADNIDEKDTENKKYNVMMGIMATGTFLGAVVILASALGGNAQIGMNDTNKTV